MKLSQVKPLVATLPDEPAMEVITICLDYADMKRFWKLNRSTQGAFQEWLWLAVHLPQMQPRPELN